MTVRQIYEGVLVELNKVQHPSLLLEDFNYFFNKAIYQYINKRYNIYDINQQTTDDMHVLKSTVRLPVTSTSKVTNVTGANSLYGATYQFDLPSDYLHLLNCICEYRVAKPFKCYDAGTYVTFGAERLTPDLWAQIINNFYMRPQYKKPYYYIHNINVAPTYDVANKRIASEVAGGHSAIPSSTTIGPTNPVDPITHRGTDINTVQGLTIKDSGNQDIPVTDINRNQYIGSVSGGLPSSLTIGDKSYNTVERVGQMRYGNPSNVRIEIRYGKDDTLFQLSSIYVDYIKTPQYVRLTQAQLDTTEDTSQIMEFPDYVCQEIINELVHIIMENSSDPRLQSHIPVSQSIANPAQQQAQTTQK